MNMIDNILSCVCCIILAATYKEHPNFLCLDDPGFSELLSVYNSIYKLLHSVAKGKVGSYVCTSARLLEEANQLKE